jgi:hypothetical protein
MRIFSASRLPLAVVAVAAAAPRVAVLLHERESILAEFTEKSDDFARTLVESGTYGFVPGVPSAYTQPLYGWFLALLYWTLERSWLVVGLAQTAVAVAVALVVYETGRRYLSPRAGLAAALLATVHPYLVWHDVHVNREILDQLVGAAAFYLTLRLAERRSLPLAAALGAVLGLAVLGNSRLAALPLALALYLLWRHAGVAGVAVVLGACALVVAPWVARNRVEVGCFALTTDARALWKANNEHTYETLRAGGWIDDVPPLPGAPELTPEFARDIYLQEGRIVHVDECAQMRLYRRATIDFWQEQPAEKARLAVQATGMLWDPRPTRTAEGTSSSRWSGGDAVEAAFAVALFGLAAFGLFVVPRPFLALALLFLAYQTLAAMVFAGATRYRVSWDFVLALLAGAAVDRLAARFRKES